MSYIPILIISLILLYSPTRAAKPCNTEDPLSFRMSLSGVYHCVYREENDMTKSGYTSHIIVWNRNTHDVRYKIAVVGDGEKRSWTRVLEGNDTDDIVFNAASITSVVITNVEQIKL